MQKKVKHFEPAYNVTRRVKEEQKYRDFQEYSKKMQGIGRTTDWHETQQKYSVWKNNSQTNKKIEAELEQANEDLKVLRNQRLKELYEKEMEQYQEELGEMGLAIAYVGNDE